MRTKKPIETNIELTLEALDDLLNQNSANPLSSIKVIEKTTRMEIGSQLAEFLSNPQFVQKLINIGYKYASDESVVEQVLWALAQISGRIFWAMRLNDSVFEADTQEVYDFFLKYINSNNPKIKFAVASGIIGLSEFSHYPQKWEYIVSIPSIPPKKRSIILFRRFVADNITDIPREFKCPIYRIIRDYIDKTVLDVTSKNLFEDTLFQLGYSDTLES